MKRALVVAAVAVIYVFGVSAGTAWGDGPSADYTKCADELGTCSVSGTATVAFGASGEFVYKVVTGSIDCTTDAFGSDPISGTKACYWATSMQIQWGQSGDTPLTGDFDHDGLADVAVWRPSTGDLYVALSSRAYDRLNPCVVSWGISGDQAYTGDFNGDGYTDLLIYRPSDSTFYVYETAFSSTDCSSPSPPNFSFSWPEISGKSPTITVGDVDGDGIADVSAWIPDADGSGNSQFLALTSGTGWSSDFASVAPWGLSSDSPLLMHVSSTTKEDAAVWRPSSSQAFAESSAYGFPIQRELAWPVTAGAGRYAYAPDIIKQGSDLYMFSCGSALEGGDDNIWVSKSTDDGKTWGAPTDILWPNSPHSYDSVTGVYDNGSFCDPSVVHFDGYYYLYNSNDFDQSSDTSDNNIVTYVTVSRLPEGDALDSSDSSWTTLDRSGNWVHEPSDPKGVVWPKHALPNGGKYGYGAGEQSVMVVGSELVMYYVDDSESPDYTNIADFDTSIDHCWPIYRMTSTDGVTWDYADSTATNACGHSPVVKWDPSTGEYVLVRIDSPHNTNAHIVVQYSTNADGTTFGSETEVVPSWILPHYSHNLGVEGDEYGQLVTDETPLLVWGGQADFRYDSNFGLPWDLYGARLNLTSVSPTSVSQTIQLSGSSDGQALAGDVDGDGYDDLAIFNPSGTDSWSFAESTHGWDASGGPNAVADFGGSGTPFLAHFNPATPAGADLVVWDSSTGNWDIGFAASYVH